MDETTRRDGQPCAWCGAPVRQSGIGRSRDYCGRSCRELAYRARRQQRLIDEAVARALEAAAPPPVSSTVDRPQSDASVVESVRPPGRRPKRRPLLPPFPGAALFDDTLLGRDETRTDTE